MDADLYPQFHGDEDGNIVAHSNGNTITIVYAHRRADYHSDPTAPARVRHVRARDQIQNQDSRTDGDGSPDYHPTAAPSNSNE